MIISGCETAKKFKKLYKKKGWYGLQRYGNFTSDLLDLEVKEPPKYNVKSKSYTIQKEFIEGQCFTMIHLFY